MARGLFRDDLNELNITNLSPGKGTAPMPQGFRHLTGIDLWMFGESEDDQLLIGFGGHGVHRAYPAHQEIWLGLQRTPGALLTVQRLAPFPLTRDPSEFSLSVYCNGQRNNQLRVVLTSDNHVKVYGPEPIIDTLVADYALQAVVDEGVLRGLGEAHPYDHPDNRSDAYPEAIYRYEHAGKTLYLGVWAATGPSRDKAFDPAERLFLGFRDGEPPVWRKLSYEAKMIGEGLYALGWEGLKLQILPSESVALLDRSEKPLKATALKGDPKRRAQELDLLMPNNIQRRIFHGIYQERPPPEPTSWVSRLSRWLSRG